MFDFFCLILIAAGIFIGIRRGISSQIGALAGFVLGIIICQVFADDVAAHWNSPDDSAGTRLLHSVLSYVGLFVACYLGGRMVGYMLKKTVRTLRLSPLDRLAGAVFNVFEFMLGFSLLLNLWVSIFPDTKIESSHESAVPVVLDLAPKVLGSETAQEILGTTGSVKDSLEKWHSDNKAADTEQNTSKQD